MLPPAPAPDQNLRPVAASPPWQLRLLGAVVARRGTQALTRWPSRAAIALLARLALGPDRAHAREELVELLWPGVSLDVGRNRLRQTLSTLKSVLEADGGPVILADRSTIRLVPESLSSDAIEFEQLARRGDVVRALDRYGGELMPSFYDEWVLEARAQLSAQFEQLRALAPGPEIITPTRRGLMDDALPAYLTRYYGVDAQAARLRREVLSQRLVTLVGPGGIGKTRLAVELAQALCDTPDLAGADNRQLQFGRVGFVALAACSTVAQMLDALAQAFGLTCGSNEVADRLVQVLAEQRTLLVLDNLEQLLPDAAPLVAQLTLRLPALHVLATSRRVLGLDGEREVVLSPLPLPEPDAALVDLAANPAVALFVDRAQAVRADFHLGTRNSDAVAALVQLLGGAPLAIELAAARVRSIGLTEMQQHLGAARQTGVGRPGPKGLDLLSRPGPRSGVDTRHASMEAVIAWSWQLLPMPLQHTLSAMTVFVGGFTAAAAAAVLDPEVDLILQLDEAVQHSLLSAEPQADDSLRYRFSEPVREYALARLPPGDAPALRRRHRDWWPHWMASLGTTVPLAPFRSDLPNIVAALASADADGDVDQGVRLALALRAGFKVVPLPGGGIDHLERLLTKPGPADPALRSLGLSLLAALAFDAGLRRRAQAHADRALQDAPPDSLARAHALQVAARIAWTAHHDREAVCRLLDEGLPLAEQLGDARLQATMLAQRAYAQHVSLGQLDQAAALFARQRGLLQALDNRHDVHHAMYHQVNLDYQRNHWGQTIAGARRLIELAQADHDWALVSKTANVLGGALRETREWHAALPCYLQAAEVAWADRDHFNWAYAVWNLPAALVRCGRPDDAMRLMAFAAHHWTTRFGELTAADQRTVQRVTRLARTQLGAARCAELEQEGRSLSPAQAMQSLRSAITAARSQPAPP